MHLGFHSALSYRRLKHPISRQNFAKPPDTYYGMILLMKLCLSIAIIIFQYVKGISNSFVKPRVLLEERKRKRRNQFLSGKCFLRKICDSTKNCDQVHATEVDCETQDKKWFPLLRPLKYQQIR